MIERYPTLAQQRGLDPAKAALLAKLRESQSVPMPRSRPEPQQPPSTPMANLEPQQQQASPLAQMPRGGAETGSGGLLSGLLGGEGGSGSGLLSGVLGEGSSDLLLAIGAGMSQDPDDPWGGFSRGALQGRQLQRERQAQMRAQQEQQAQANATLDFAVSRGLMTREEADGLRATGLPPDVAKAILTQSLKPEGSGARFGLNPIHGTDANGNSVLLQVSDTGEVRQVQTPEGITISTGVDKIDGGTVWYLQDKKSGQIIGTVPKDVEGEEAAKVRGKAQGEAQVDLGGALQKAEYSIQLIDDMIAHPGRETATGMSGWVDPRNYMAGSHATDFNVRRKQMEGRVFLEAFESLKGGGHITEIEGQKATEAVARLDTAQSDEAYLQALQELRAILQAGMERARQRAGQSAEQAGSPQPLEHSGGGSRDALKQKYGLE